jgi:hypothetical protein
MIRIAWTLYLKRNFADAALKLDEFVRFVAELKKPTQQRRARLRDDAIRYIAKCYVEEDWDLDGNPDNGWGFPRLDRDYKDRGGSPTSPRSTPPSATSSPARTTGSSAIKIYDTALQRWPTAAAAPALQKKILDAHDRPRRRDGVRRKARELLASNYLRGTPWFFANESDTDAIESAMKLVEDALVASAVERHAYAQTLRAAGDPQGRRRVRAPPPSPTRPTSPATPTPRAPTSTATTTPRASSTPASTCSPPRPTPPSATRTPAPAARSTPPRASCSRSRPTSRSEQKAGRVTLPDMPKQGVAKGPFEPKKFPSCCSRCRPPTTATSASSPTARRPAR